MKHAESGVLETNLETAGVADARALLDSEMRVVPCPSCFLCGATGAELYQDTTDWLFGVSGTWGWRRCPECEVLWLDPQPRLEDIPRLYSRYYTHAAPLRPPSFNGLRRATLQYELARLGYRVQIPKGGLARLLSFVPPIARANSMEVLNLLASEVGTLLDVGCGSGEFIGKMSSRSQGFQVFHGTIADVPRQAHYDVITLSHVIEHVADPVALLQECKQRLKPGTGRIVLTTPNLDSMGHHWFKRFWRGLEVLRHPVLFSAKGLARCLSQAGLTPRTLRTETRIAVRIHNASASAREGGRNVAERTRFNPKTKIAGYFFMALENALLCFNKTAGEELFCICTAE